jgi:general secretion pathway protein D
LRGVIDQLDVRRAQVYIEALVVEVTSNDAAEFGVQWVGLTGNENSSYRVGGLQSFSVGGNSNNLVNLALAAATGISGSASSAASGGASIPNPTGLSIGLFKQVGGALGLGAIAHALESTGHANILSTPNLITLDNELATIKVGQNIPIVTGSFTTGASGASNPFQTVDRKDVGLLLKVRPQISEGGTIKMAIYHENSGIDNSVTSTAGIVTTVRAIESNVLADDGQIVVLGGLISDDEGENEQKVRGLGDIPVIGNLFKYRARNRGKRNLMVFLRPIVVRSKEQNESISMDRYQYMRAAGSTAQPAGNSVLIRDLGAPLLPPLTNGQPPVGGDMATAPPPAPVAPRPGAATGTGTTQPLPNGLRPQPRVEPEFRPVQPIQK